MDFSQKWKLCQRRPEHGKEMGHQMYTSELKQRTQGKS